MGGRPSPSTWSRAGLSLLVAACCACAHVGGDSAAAARPGYPHGGRPTVSQAAQDRALIDYYRAWKAHYVRHGDCGADRAYIDSSRDAGEAGSITVSEAHGWGMLILAMMSPWDDEARGLFDGMVRLARDHPSTLKSGLMAWDVHAPCTTPQHSTSAPDGDLDIAFALLLADRLWGSAGGLDYGSLARAHMAALMRSEAVPEHGYFKLWEDIGPGEAHAGETRTSDSMFGHFRAFARASGDPAWRTMTENTFAMLKTLSSASPAGFFPDFAADLEGSPVPAPQVFRDDGRDGTYSYNACRLPMRWAIDWLTHGDPRSLALTEQLVESIRQAAAGDPKAVMDGYALDGRAVGTRNRLAFVAPLAVGAMASPRHQAFLDALWGHLVAAPLEEADGYYGNVLKMLALIVLSGHWLEPAG